MDYKMFYFLRLTVIFAFLQLICGGLQATAKPVNKPSFATNDVFQSAVFQQNNGLIEDYKGNKVYYFVQYNHINAYFTEKGVLYKIGPTAAASLTEQQKEKGREEDEDEEVPAYTSLVTMNWQNANPNPEIVAGEKAPGYHIYLDGDNQHYKTITTQGYKTLLYKNVYPGIDIQYSFPDKGGIKYNVIVNPGADAAQIKLLYAGDLLSLDKSGQGDITIHTQAGDLMEHAPYSFSANGQVAASNFSLTDNSLQFILPDGYDKTQTLTIDPWITATTFTPDNIGFDVDYDTTGAAFAYGSGPTTTASTNKFFEVSKYTPAGVLSWTFNGSVGAIGWNSYSASLGKNYAGNILVEKGTGKIYVAKGHDGNGTSVIRLTGAGVYDNFQSTINSNFQEDWGIGYNCVNSSLLALGGGVSSNINMAVINTTTGATTNTNITTTGAGFSHEDIICGVFDNSGNLYVLMDDFTDPTAIPFTNTLYRVNSTLNGYTWVANSGYTPFTEEWNGNFWQTLGSTNWSNCLAANGSYLYYYDGLNLVAHSFTTGAPVGTATTIAGYSATYQGGIAVDNCNNVYLGGIGVIKTFTFNGATFAPGADIPLGGAFGAAKVEDVKYNSANNTLYVTGVGFVGVYAATLSATCNPITVSSTCTSATATITGGAANTYSYTWTNTTGTVVSQTNASASATNTATGLTPGKYYVRVVWQANCNGSAIFDSVTVVCPAGAVTVNDTTICNGGQAKLYANGTPTGGTYSWSTGAGNVTSITVSPTTTTTYTVTYTPLTGAAVTAVATVTVNNAAPTVQVNDTTICNGNNATVYATVTGGTGGTYLWSNGATTQTITVSPNATTTYTVTYTELPCGSASGTGTVTVNNAPQLTVNSPSICSGGTATLNAAGSPAGGTYGWSTGAGNVNSITVSPATNTTYTVTYTTQSCGSATMASSVTVINNAAVTVSDTTICPGGTGTITATPTVSGGTYSWSPGNFTTQSITVSPGGTTVYSVTFTPIGCPAATNSGTVTVETPPSVTLTERDPTCNTQGEITATATQGTAPYEYSLSGGAFQEADSFNNLTGPGYMVVVKDTFGCLSNPASINLTPYQPISLGLVVDSINCSNPTGQIIATATGGLGTLQYSINGGALQNSGTFSGLAVGTYVIAVKDSVGCTTSQTAQLLPAGTVSVTPYADSALCHGTATGKVIATTTGGSRPYQYALNGGTYQSSDSFNNLPAGSYTVQVMDAGGCVASGTAQVFEPTQLQVISVTSTPIKCPGTNTGTITVVVGGGTSPYNYASSTDSANFEYTSGNSIIDLDTGKYWILVSDNKGCTIVSAAYVAGALPDSFSRVADSTTCYGSQYKDGSITVTPVFLQNGPFQYAVNGGAFQSSPVFTGLAAGIYQIQAMDTNGCLTTVTQDTVFQPGPSYAVAYPTDTSIKIGQSVQITSSLIGAGANSHMTYSWAPWSGLSCIDCQNPVFSSYAEENAYTVTITYNGDCTVEASVNIIVNFSGEVYIPNCFTPNGDGNNDVFEIFGHGIERVDLRVFNRWGEKVFESHNQFQGWDGTYKGMLQMPAVFVYEAQIYFLDGSQRFMKGSVTLVR